MGLTFWDTVRGVRLADTLIHELPELTREKKQVVKTFYMENIEDRINEYIENHYEVSHIIPLGTDKFLCVFTK